MSEHAEHPFVNRHALPTVLFVLLDGLFSSPLLVKLAVGIAKLCIVLFFVTSLDTASMVIDVIAPGGNQNPHLGTRLFWALTGGVVSAALLIARGLPTLDFGSVAFYCCAAYVLRIASPCVV